MSKTNQILASEDLKKLAKLLRGKRWQIIELTGLSKSTVDNTLSGRHHNPKVLIAAKDLAKEIITEKNLIAQSIRKDLRSVDL